MKVSVNWINKFTKVTLSVDELVEKIGAQLGAIEEVINLGERYRGVVAVKVVSCQKHPDADKLHVCLIDDGGKTKEVKRDAKGLVQVVCGAPNVKEGLTVAWIPPGATVPSTYNKDPFVLEARELRGVVSNGMLASAKELAIGDSHEGLLIIDEPAKPGTPFAEVYELNDYIIDIENKMFTHRPDCFGILGVAREVAGIQGKQFKSPDWYKENEHPAEGFGLELRVDNEAKGLVPRFSAIAMKDVTVGPSQVRLQTNLVRHGIRPINNIVDITNFIMLLTGQPVHAYDYDKVKTGTLGVRPSKAGESLALLNGKTIKLKSGTLIITDGQKPIGLAGVMGGADTEVDENTKNIILECANFDMNLTRQTAMEYGLFTDAVTRFSKGQSPLQNSAVLNHLVSRVETLADGKIASRLIDEKSARVQAPKAVEAETIFINSRLGSKLTPEQIKKLLENVEFKVAIKGQKISVTPPFWRTDIEIAEDVVEEVGRLYGYDKLPQDLPSRSLAPASKDHRSTFKSRLREIMDKAGANEVLTYSFVDEKLLKAAGQDPDEAYHVKNAVSPELQYYRLNLAPSLLSKVRPNIKNGYDYFLLFEIGKGHVKGALDDEDLPEEIETLAAVTVNPFYKGAPYYQARDVATYLLEKLNITELTYQPMVEAKPAKKTSWLNCYEPTRSAIIWSGKSIVGFIGEPNQSLRTALKLPAHVAMFELNIPNLYNQQKERIYQALNRFPSSSQDICLRFPASTSYGEADEFVWNMVDKLCAKEGFIYEMETLDIFQRKNDSTHHQITWRITLYHPERTLTTEEVNTFLDQLAVLAKKDLKAERV